MHLGSLFERALAHTLEHFQFQIATQVEFSCLSIEVVGVLVVKSVVFLVLFERVEVYLVVLAYRV